MSFFQWANDTDDKQSGVCHTVLDIKQEDVPETDFIHPQTQLTFKTSQKPQASSGLRITTGEPRDKHRPARLNIGSFHSS